MKNALLFFSFLVICFSSTSFAQEEEGRIYIKVGDAQVKKSLLAFPPFNLLSTPSLAPNHKTIGSEIYNTAVNDMEVSNLFTLIKPDAYLEEPANTGLTPAPGNPNGFKFENWAQIKAEFLVRGGYKVTEAKQLELEIYLYYVPQAKLVLGKKYTAPSSEARKVAHTFADDVIKALTGKPGIFSTKFVLTSDRAGKGHKEIYVMDWDGRNVLQASTHKSISLSPAWHPNGKTISYTSFAYHPKWKSRNIDLFTYNLDDGKRYLVSSYKGINSGSTFSPDGKWIYLTLSKDGDPNIYRIDTDGNGLSQITKGPRNTMNVEPNISSDGKRIAFSSDRAGNPMIYTMNIDGSNLKRVTFAGKYNSSPVFSPDGKRIAFAGLDKGAFDIFIMDTDGANMSRLTSAKKPSGSPANNEDPSFSPDGRHLVFTSDRTGKNQVYIISVDGTTERRITADNFNYYKPKWSPYLTK